MVVVHGSIEVSEDCSIFHLVDNNAYLSVFVINTEVDFVLLSKGDGSLGSESDVMSF
jgi:hypothetical protein